MDIRATTADDIPAFYAAIELAFLGDARDDEREHEFDVFDPARGLVATDGDLVVGTAGTFGFDMSVPGGSAPVAGVTMVSVAPTHRRRGILTALMRRQLDELYETGGEPVAALWASEPAIYQRFGYGGAAWSYNVEVPTRGAAFRSAPDPGYEIRLVPAEELPALADPVHEAVRASRPGLHRRDAAWWRHRLYDPEHRRQGASSLRHAVCRGADGIEGYALYSQKGEWVQGVPNGATDVRELLARTPAAETALWRFLLDLDLTTKLTVWNLPPDSALLHLLLDVRPIHARLKDNLWVRVVDLPRALTARRYAVPDELVVEVVDAFCPWNSGRWRLAAGDDGAACDKTTDEPDLVLGATELGALYLGGTPATAPAGAGRIEERSPGALRRADRLFGWWPAPWSAQVF